MNNLMVLAQLSALISMTGALLPFPSGTTNGYIVALSLPVDINDRNIYMSNNLEANYALPTNSTDFTQGLYNNILFVDGVNPVETDRSSLGFHLFSRRNIYEMIEQRMNKYAIDGHACLLRMICEVSDSSFDENNGVAGSLFHILLTPSSSVHEAGTDEYISAEQEQNCMTFNSRCSLSLMKLISVLMK